MREVVSGGTQRRLRHPTLHVRRYRMTDDAAVHVIAAIGTCGDQHVPGLSVGVGEYPRVAPGLLRPRRGTERFVPLRIGDAYRPGSLGPGENRSGDTASPMVSMFALLSAREKARSGVVHAPEPIRSANARFRSRWRCRRTHRVSPAGKTWPWCVQFRRSGEVAWPMRALRCRRSGSPSDLGACRIEHVKQLAVIGDPEIPDPMIRPRKAHAYPPLLKGFSKCYAAAGVVKHRACR